jgi:broad specificity phosphatase PhoE
MEHFDELEFPDVNAPSAHEYVLAAHERYPGLIKAAAGRLIEGLIETRKYGGERTLVVSHNLVLSSLLLELTGQTDSFANLSGMVLSVSDGGVSFLSRTKDIQT